MIRHRALLAALALAVLAVAPRPSHAGAGGPDPFGYTWRDSNDSVGCPIVSDPTPVNAAQFASFVIGPIDIGFPFPFYDRIVSQVWFQQAGLVCFQAPPTVGLFTNQDIPRAGDGVAGFIAPHWSFLVNETPNVNWESDPVNGVFRAQFNYVRPQSGTLPLTFQVYLYRSGDIRIEYLEPSDATTVTIGMEGFTENNAQALKIRYNATQLGGMTYGVPGPTFAICIRRPKNLVCTGATQITCDSTTNGTSPASLPTNATSWGCGSGTWAGKERVYRIDVAELSDIQISLAGTGARIMAAYLLRACDESDCVAGGTSSFQALTVPPGTYYIAVDALATRDEGAFTLNVTCTPLSEPIACTETLSDTTAGQPGRLNNYSCFAGDFGGAEQFYTVDFVPPGNINVSLASATGQGVFILDPSQPLSGDACLTGGVGGAVLFDPPAGTYLIAIDGPIGGDGAYTVSVNCVPEISCAPGAGTLSCQQEISGSTIGLTPRADFYRCASEQFSGPEAVYVFTQTATETVSFLLDTANPNLDLILLDSCNEGACIEVSDTTLSKELPPGTYYLVVDGRNGAAADYTLTTICGFGLEPAALSVTGAEGECFTEHKNGWLTPELAMADVLFAIDLTGTMSAERAQLDDNMQDIIARLSLFVDDLAFGLVSQVDYPLTLTTPAPCSYTGGYAGTGEWPYRLHQPITTDMTAIQNAVNNLPTGLVGGDTPESMSRVLWECSNDPTIGWRPGSSRIVVYFTDETPHDCNVLECLGGVAAPRGADPGRDNVVGTADDITAMDAVRQLAANNIVLLPLDSSEDFGSMGADTFNIWNCWAQMTGGRADRLNQDGTVPSGIDLSELIAELIRAQGSFCRELTLRAEPGWEAWVQSVVDPLADIYLPAAVEFDITFCVPPGTPAGPYDFLVQLMCGDQVVTTQQVHVDVTRDCAATVVTPPQDVTICQGDTTTLDASGMTLVNCAGTSDFEWRNGSDVVVGNAATLDVSPAATETFTVSLTCSTDITCSAVLEAVVTVETRPQVQTGTVVDPQTCNLGLDLAWDAATFPSGSGYYNVYRSETSCADALTRPPINPANLSATSYIDPGTRDGRTYYYVVQAEDAGSAIACRPPGPNNGGIVSATNICLGPITEVDTVGFPDLLGWSLRVGHAPQGDEVTLDWTGARALLPLEHFHVLKGVDPRVLGMVNPENQVSLTWTETDTSSRLQFFDVRIANACEEVSADDEPQGWDQGR